MSVEDDIKGKKFSVSENFVDENGLTWFYRVNPETGEAVLFPEEVIKRKQKGYPDIVKPAVRPAPTGVLRIPDSINGHLLVGVGPQAFEGLVGKSYYASQGPESFNEISIPPSVRYIAYAAFRNCTSVIKLSTALSAEVVGPFSFEGCSKLRMVEFGKCVRKIEMYAFCDCADLQKVWFSEGLYCIEGEAFAKCYRLMQVDLPDSISFVGDGAFRGSDCRITYPESLGFGFSSSVRWRMRTNNPLKRGLFNFLNREHLLEPSRYQ